MRGSTVHTGALRRLALALAAVALTLPLALAPVPAEAQQVIRRCNGLFDCLFNRGPQRAEPAPQRRAPATRQPRQRSQQGRAAPRTPRAAAPQPAPEPQVDKLDNAKAVLVVGDFLASGLADGLEEAYAASPGVRIVERTNGSSGFVRDDFYDWNAEIGPILDETKPDIVVVMMGSNDRQEIATGGRRLSPRSEPWTSEYRNRVKTFADAVAARDIPLIWTGLPPFKSTTMSSDMLVFNDIYKHAAEDAGGTFVDIWEGFVDENGNFVFNGPDVNGQTVQLRGSDGINLTRAARRKVAFYVEKPLNKILGGAADPDAGASDMEAIAMPVSPDLPRPDPDRTQPVSLTDPDPDSVGELLGARPLPANTAKADEDDEEPADTTEPAPLGRADDFSLETRPPEDDTATSAITR